MSEQTTGSDASGPTPVRVERSQKWIRAYLGGEAVADTREPLLVWENPHYPTYYFPAADVRAKLVATGATEHAPGRGTAELFDVVAERKTAPGAARRYADSPLGDLRDAVRLDWHAMDEWLEEDEPIYAHARDPHKRVDILASSRHVRVELDGVTLAESRSPRILYETSLPPRYYLPLTDLRLDLLVPSDKQTFCPYKGRAAYWSVRLGERTYDDYVWIYRTPLPESQRIAGLACFYNEKVDLYVDGVRLDRARTQFS
jgi:uncharacterized protein (DUF427 family)